MVIDHINNLCSNTESRVKGLFGRNRFMGWLNGLRLPNAQLQNPDSNLESLQTNWGLALTQVRPVFDACACQMNAFRELSN